MLFQLQFIHCWISDKQNKRPSYQFSSVISEIFDGELRSSVQCLTCDQVCNEDDCVLSAYVVLGVSVSIGVSY